VLAFALPRVPSFALDDGAPLINVTTGSFANSIPFVFSRAPANFTFPAFAQLDLNTQSSYVPIAFTKIAALVYDLETNQQVGTGGLLAEKTVPAKAFPKIELPLNFSYIATNDTDQTCENAFRLSSGSAQANELSTPPPPQRVKLVQCMQKPAIVC